MESFDVLAPKSVSIPRNAFVDAVVADKRSLVFAVTRFLADNFSNVSTSPCGLLIDDCKVSVRGIDSSHLDIPSFQKGFGRHVDLAAARSALSKLDFFLLVSTTVEEAYVNIHFHTFLPSEIGG
jgi:hypothetical protein